MMFGGIRLTSMRTRCLPGVLLITLGGCGVARLRVEDVVTVRGERAVLTAYAERSVAAFLRGGERGVKVRFLVNGREVGATKTDADGKATVECRLPREGAQRVEAVASLTGQKAKGSGQAFVWRQDRPILIVDVDATISETDYFELTLAPIDRSSRPIKDASRTLKELSKDFYIAYFTARPRSLMNKTRRWLADHDFPPGPVLGSSGSGDVIWQAAFKHKLIGDLRQRWPNLLIGVGDNGADTDAFGHHEMLTVIVNDGLFAPRGAHVVKMQNWRAVADFFRANRETLISLAKLQDAIKGKTLMSNQPARTRVSETTDREARSSAAEPRVSAADN
jgi:hypothetical protein